MHEDCRLRCYLYAECCCKVFNKIEEKYWELMVNCREQNDTLYTTITTKTTTIRKSIKFTEY